MLSTTYTLTDMKTELESGAKYGYDDTLTNRIITSTGITATNNATRDYFTKATGGFTTAGFQAGDTIRISGFSTTGWNTSFTIYSVTDTVITVTAAETAATDAGGESVTIQSHNSFDRDLTYCVDTAKRERMLPVMGEDDYTAITGLDKSGCTTEQLYIYWAEIYYSIAEFYLFKARRDKYNRLGATESRSEGGVSSQSSSGTIGKEMAARDYIKKGDKLLAQYGYETFGKLVRRESVHVNDGY